MPFAAPTNFDEQDPEKKNQSGGVNISGQSASFATNVPGQEQSSSGTKQNSSGQYTNIQSYLDANHDQADQMGQKITEGVSKEADDASQKIQSFDSKAPTVETYDPNEALKNATTLSDQDKSKYKTFRSTGGYTGPQNIDQVDGYQETAKAATTASQKVKNAGTEFGQQQLLKDTYARPQYSAGENKLDQVLLANSAGSKANLENLTSKYSNLDQLFNDTTQKVGTAINQANTQALANRNAFAPAEQQARTELLTPIQQRAQQAAQTQDETIKQYMDAAQNNTLSLQQLKQLGLTGGMGIFDLNLASYLTPDKTQIGLDNVASTDERQKYQALASLFDDPTMTEITADGKSIKPITMNSAQFQKDLDAKAAEYQNAYKTSRGTLWQNEVDATNKNIGNATPEELEKIWIPYYQDLAARGVSGGQAYLNDINQALARFRDQYQVNRTIQSGSTSPLPGGK